jgi:hypothetical protein
MGWGAEAADVSKSWEILLISGDVSRFVDRGT